MPSGSTRGGLSSDFFRGWARLDAAGFLTDDEKRAAAGYGPKPEEVADDSTGPFAQKYNPSQPRVPAGGTTHRPSDV